MPVISSSFRAPFWIRNAHAQTIWATVTQRYPALETRREELILSDGDFIDLDWAGPESGPITIILHGLEGSIDSPYARGIMQRFSTLGRRTVLLHFRGCSGRPNRAQRAYHSGETEDLAEVVRHIQTSQPNAPISLVGYSLGGNVVLKWLGTDPLAKTVEAAAAVSVPFDLDRCATRLNTGLSRIYQRRFLETLHAKFREKNPEQCLDDHLTLRQWDDAVTAPLHGFKDAAEYYRQSSCAQYLSSITCPTLIIHAKDDPFMTADTIPDDTALSATVSLEMSDHGGHVGFVQGSPWKPTFYLESRIPTFILSHSR